MRLDHLLSKETSVSLRVYRNILVRLLVKRAALFNLEGASLLWARRYGEGYGACIDDGGLAQLVEHLLCKQGVTGSSPVTSTRMGQ